MNAGVTSEAAPSFTQICAVDELWEGEMRAFDVNGRAVLVVKLQGDEVVALQGTCPHQRIPLHEGTLQGNLLTCRAHLWQFDVTTGRGVNPAECKLARYPVKIDNGAVWVSVKGITTRARLLG